MKNNNIHRALHVHCTYIVPDVVGNFLRALWRAVGAIGRHAPWVGEALA